MWKSEVDAMHCLLSSSSYFGNKISHWAWSYWVARIAGQPALRIFPPPFLRCYHFWLPNVGDGYLNSHSHAYMASTLVTHKCSPKWANEQFTNDADITKKPWQKEEKNRFTYQVISIFYRKKSPHRQKTNRNMLKIANQQRANFIFYKREVTSNEMINDCKHKNTMDNIIWNNAKSF